MTSRGPDHKLAQALDLARREAQLTTADLAKALSFNPRTVRRYLNGERRPERETVVRWEQACKATPGTLTALYDGTPPSHAPPPAPARLARRLAMAAIAVFVALAAVLLLRGDDEPNLGAAASQQRPSGVAYHRFTASYVGDIWVRITPTREHTGERHRVTLHWGHFTQEVDLKNLDRSRALFTGKRSADDIPMQVSVKPAATIAFGERNVPPGARDVNRGWKRYGRGQQG